MLAVQHIAPGFLRGFVDWLQTVVRLEVRIAEPGQRAEPGHVYFAPEDNHLGVSWARRLVVLRLLGPGVAGAHGSAATVLATVSTSASDSDWWIGMESMSSEARSAAGHRVDA